MNQVTITYLGVCLGRYADLKNNRLTNYTFNFDQMLNDQVCSLFADCCFSFMHFGVQLKELSLFYKFSDLV